MEPSESAVTANDDTDSGSRRRSQRLEYYAGFAAHSRNQRCRRILSTARDIVRRIRGEHTSNHHLDHRHS